MASSPGIPSMTGSTSKKKGNIVVKAILDTVLETDVPVSSIKSQKP